MADAELDDRVREIVELMLRDQWRPGASHLEFARKYGVEPVTVRRWASEAGRFIRLCNGSQDDIRDELLSSIRRVGGKAEDAEDYRSANQSLELAAKVHGLLDRKSPDDEPEHVSAERVAAALRERGWKVEAPNGDSSERREAEGDREDGGADEG